MRGKVNMENVSLITFGFGVEQTSYSYPIMPCVDVIVIGVKPHFRLCNY